MYKHATINRAFRLVWSALRGAYLVAPESARARNHSHSRSVVQPDGRQDVLPQLIARCSGSVCAGYRLGAWLTNLHKDSCLLRLSKTNLLLLSGLFGGTLLLFPMPGNAQVMPATTVVPSGGKTNAYIAPNGVPVVNINTANAAGLSNNTYTRYDVEARGLVLNNGNASQAARQSQLAGQVMANVNLADQAKVILNQVVAPNRSILAGFTEVLGGKADVIVANPYGITCSGCGFINTDRITLTTGVPNFAANGSVSNFRVSQGDILINGNGLNASAQQILDLVSRAVKLEANVNVGGTLGITSGTNVWDYNTRAVSASTAATDLKPNYAIDSTALGGMYAGRIRLIATEAGVGVRMLGNAAANVDDFTLENTGKIILQSQLSAVRDLKINSTDAAVDAIRLEQAQLAANRQLALDTPNGGLSVNGNDKTLLYAKEVMTLNAQSDLVVANMKVLSDGALNLNAHTIRNSGTLESQGNAAFTISSALENSGTLLVNGDLVMRGGTNAAYTVNNQGTLQTTKLLDIQGQGGSKAVHVQIGDAQKMLAGSLVVNAETVTLAERARLSTSGNFALAADTLNLNGVDSKIIAAKEGGDATLTLANAYSNQGMLFSGGNLALAAPVITNTNNGGIAARDTLSVRATGSDLTNAGSLYGGQQVNLYALGSLTNSGTLNRAEGTINSAGSIQIQAAAFHNQGEVNAVRDISITAATFKNEVAGGDTRQWRQTAYYNDHDPKNPTQEYSCGALNGGWCVDEYMLEVRTMSQYYAGGTPTFKPQIIGGSRVTVQGFDTGYNTGGVISAPILTFQGGGANSTFVNNDLSLNHTEYKKTWEKNSFWAIPSMRTTHPPTSQSTKNENNTSPTFLDSSIGAGLFATTLNAGGFALVNLGAPYTASVKTTTAPSTPVGLNFTTPNPNGYFVLSKNPNAKYLVETNPMYALGSNFLSSNYLAQRLGYNPDVLQKALGDSQYEAWLIRQQLIAQTGRNVLNTAVAEAEQIQRFYDNAYNQSQNLGLAYGVPPTPEQQAKLTQDIVWMVQQEVQGQPVLVPMVYLAQQTRDSLTTGAVIAANDVNLDLTALRNSGGTITADNTLTIKSVGDVTNEGGTLRGGDVSIQSTSGSINNLTREEGDRSVFTALGKTATIQAERTLALEAATDVKNIGASINAQGDASIIAGRDVILDTVVKADTESSSSSSSGFLSNSRNTTTTKTEKNIAATLNSGGDLRIQSGRDTTIAGSNVNVGGNLDANTGGSLNILARQDKVTTSSESSSSGLGVGGGVFGFSTTTKETFKGTNVGSTLTVAGDGKIKSAQDVVLQGSDLTIAGSGDIQAKGNVKIRDGLDEERSKTHTETTTFLDFQGTGSTKTDSSANPSTGRSSASFDANASAKADGSIELNLSKTTTSDTKKSKTTSVASNFKVQGDLNIQAGDTLTIQGSNLEAGGNAKLAAQNVEVLTGRNTEILEVTSKVTKTGLFVEGKAAAEAEAQAKATGMTANAKAGGSANANAEGVATLGVRLESNSLSSASVKNVSSTIKTGGDLNIQANEQAKFIGAQVAAGNDLKIEATSITNQAAVDLEVTEASSSTLTMGVYVDASGKADASAKAKASPLGVGAKVEASADATASAGLRVAGEFASSGTLSTTNLVNTFTAGNNLTRQAKGTIIDQGTELQAGNNITQTAERLIEQAIFDTESETSSKNTFDARVGVYAGAKAEANAGAQAGLGTSGAGASAEASVGVRVKATYAGESETSVSNTAVTSRYRAGGNISSVTTGATQLLGTQMEAGGNIDLQAQSLDYQAAQNTEYQTSTERSADFELKVKAKVSEKGLSGGAEASASYNQQQATQGSSSAVGGGLTASGGAIRIKTTNDARLEGVAIQAEQDVNIRSTAGSVKLDAAKSTENESAFGFNIAANLDVSDSVEVEASGGYNQSQGNAITNTVTSIRSNSGRVDISAGQDIRSEGSKIQAVGDTTLVAKGTVALLEAKDSRQESANGLQVEVSLSQDSQSGGANVLVKQSDVQSGQVSQIQSGGKLTITAEKIVSQEAALNASEKSVTGKQENIRKTQVDTGYDLEFDLDAASQKKKKADSANNGSTPKKLDSDNPDAVSPKPNPVPPSKPTPQNIDTKPRWNSSTKITHDASTSSDDKAATARWATNNNDSAANKQGKPKPGNRTNSNTQNGTSKNESTKQNNLPAKNPGADQSSASTTIEKNSTTPAAKPPEKKEMKVEVGESFSGSVSGRVKEGKEIEDKPTEEKPNQSTTPTNIVPVAQPALQAKVTLPANLPAGSVVQAQTAAGKPLPDWIKFDAKQGTFSGTPPADFSGSLQLMVLVPQADGSTQNIAVTFGKQ